jgi:hypothetical protein
MTINADDFADIEDCLSKIAAALERIAATLEDINDSGAARVTQVETGVVAGGGYGWVEK